jgi:hypothetical protein
MADLKAVPGEKRANVTEVLDRWFAVPSYWPEDGEPRSVGLKVRPGGSGSSRVGIDIGAAEAEVELIDLRRALRMAEEANRE